MKQDRNLPLTYHSKGTKNLPKYTIDKGQNITNKIDRNLSENMTEIYLYSNKLK